MIEIRHEEERDEAELYFERLRADREKDNLIEILDNIEFFHLKCAVSMLTISQLTETLSQILVKSEYPDELRALFFYVNAELTRRCIAPVWREITKITYKDPTKLPKAKQRYACDAQIIDLLWIHSKYHGHRVRNTAWDYLYNNIFKKEQFDYKQADNIANAEFTPAEKIKGLKFSDSMQLELSVLRSEKIKKRVSRAMSATHTVEVHINDAANKNPRKGKKVIKQAELWSKLWLCRKLAGKTPKDISNMYSHMTGDAINISTLRNKLNKIASALNDVNSPYYKDMMK